MSGIVQASLVLLLLAVFFAYIIAPIGDAVSRRVRLGRRSRPISRSSAIVLIYLLLFISGAVVWRTGAPAVRQWVYVTAPAMIDRVFANVKDPTAVDALFRDLPLPTGAQDLAIGATASLLGSIEKDAHAALAGAIQATPFVRWLAISPLAAFLLLVYAPRFRRSALRRLPHGHLQWRGGEYLSDVNSALAGYVRAQLTAGVIVACACGLVFSLFNLPYALSMAVVAGVLELVPVIGPLTVMLMAAGQAASHALPVVITLAGLRVVQDIVVYPRLIRHGMHLPSAVVIAAVWLGAALNGAAGVIFAIPFAGFVAVSLRHWREYRAIETLVRSAGRGAEREPEPER